MLEVALKELTNNSMSGDAHVQDLARRLRELESRVCTGKYAVDSTNALVMHELFEASRKDIDRQEEVENS